MQVSWVKGSKSAVLGGNDIKLPALNAPDTVGEAQSFWVRFIGDPKEWPGERWNHSQQPHASCTQYCKVSGALACTFLTTIELRLKRTIRRTITSTYGHLGDVCLCRACSRCHAGHPV